MLPFRGVIALSDKISHLKDNELAILIDDDIRVLSAAKEVINDRILLFHVTSLLI